MPQVNTSRDFATLVQEMHGLQKKILVEGDSWVSHPLLANLTVQFDQFGKGGYAILNLAQPGDTASRMLSPGGKQFKELASLIVNEKYGYKWDLIFLSAAGNDIVGDEIETENYVNSKIANDGLSGRQLISQSYRDRINAVAEDYQNLITFRDQSQANPETPIITHVYSYLTPRMVGTKVFGAMLGKGWVQRYLIPKGIVDEEEQKDVVRGMMDYYWDAMLALQKNNKGFLVADTRLTLSTSDTQPNMDWWHDEIHPNYTGFKRVAEAIRDAARSSGMWLD